MTLHFEAAFGSAIDVRNNIRIHQPRIHKGSSPDGAEFDYAIYRGADRDSLSCGGTSTLIENNGTQVRLFTLDLGEPSVVEAMLKLKDRLRIACENFDYFHQLARGLALVFQSRTDNTEEVLYVVFASPSSLITYAISPPTDFPRLPNGNLLLADVRLQARNLGTPSR